MSKNSIFSKETLSNKLSISLGLGAAFVFGASFASQNANATETASRYLIQYHSPSLVMKAERDLKSAMRDSLLSSNTKTSHSVRVSNFDLSIANVLKNTRMLEVMATPSQIAELQNSVDVSLVEKEFFFPAPTPLATHTTKVSSIVPNSELPDSGDLVDEGEITWGLKAVRAVEAWNQTRGNTSILAGRGSRVLVIDTGIDRDHSDIKTRFEAGRNFLGARPSALIAAGILKLLNPTLVTLDDDDGAEGNRAEDGAEGNNNYDYFDQNGHGTHVAGTILGAYNGTGVSGVAPLSHLLAGRVCGKFGCSSVGIVRAIEYGVTQNVDVINMSLGGPTPSRAGAEAVAAADAANVVVVCASGNDGKGTVSYPAAYPESLAVGAIDNHLAKAPFSNWGPELGIVAPGVDIMSSVPTGSGRKSNVSLMGAIDAEVKSTSFVGSEENTTPIIAELVHVNLGKEEDFEGKDLTGKFALVSRGEIAFADKVKYSMAAGAIGVLIYNNVPGLISGSLSQDGSSIGIPVAMIEQTVGEAVAQALEAGTVAKASIGVAVVDHAAFNGTSMASPHIAGVAALVRAANKNLNSAQVKAILKSTAVPMEADASRPNEFGAGLVNAEAAVLKALAN